MVVLSYEDHLRLTVQSLVAGPRSTDRELVRGRELEKQTRVAGLSWEVLGGTFPACISIPH